MGLFKSGEKFIKKTFGLLSGGEAAPVGELTQKKELADILKRQMQSAKSADISRAEGKLAGEQALAGVTSAIQSQKGLSSGLKQRQISGEGRKLQGKIAASTMIAGLKERQQALRDAQATASGSQSAEAARQGVISDADAEERKRRKETIGAVIQGAGSAMKGGLG